MLESRNKQHHSSIESLLYGKFSTQLDPVNYSGSMTITQNLSVDEIEQGFSHSIDLAYNEIKNSLTVLERKLFDVISKIENHIDDLSGVGGSLKEPNPAVRENFHFALKTFASRFFKRSLGVRIGFYNQCDELIEFNSHIGIEDEQKTLKKTFSSLINNGRSFNGSLITTFGQPLLQKKEMQFMFAIKLNKYFTLQAIR